MDEQSQLLEGMLAEAAARVKVVAQKAVELESRRDMVALEFMVLEAVLGLGTALLRQILTAWAASLAAKAGTRRKCQCGRCTCCQGVARWVTRRAKTVLTLLGRVTYSRVYFHCAECKHGEALGDRQLEWEMTLTSPGVKHLVGYLCGTTVGFATVAGNVCRTLRWPGNWLSGKQVQRLAEPVGQRLDEFNTTRVAQVWAKLTAGLSVPSEGKKEPTGEQDQGQAGKGRNVAQRLYVQMDGIMVRVRGTLGKGSDLYREVKVGAVFWAETGRHASRLPELVGKARAAARETVRSWVDRPKGAISYVTGLVEVDRFAVSLYVEAVGRGLERAKEIVILGDGALWIWRVAKEYFPGAIQILDFHHAEDWVYKVGQAVWGQASAKAQEWTARVIEDYLIRGDAEGLVKAIAALPKIAPPLGDPKSLPERAIEYFENNAERMHYPEYRARGLEIGSGIVESSGRRVVGVRCKQPGMRWSEAGLGSVVELRTRVLNGQYDATLASIRKVA